MDQSRLKFETVNK